MNYLNLDELLIIHLEVIQAFGGSFGVLDLEKLESCLRVPQQTMFGNDLYPDLASKAAIMFLLLIKNHPFRDGNKRTATLAMLDLLERNGYTLDATNDELYQFTMNVATSVLDKDQITNWIRSRLKHSNQQS